MKSDIPLWATGQTTFSGTSLIRPVLARVSEMPEKYEVAEHQHSWGQLAYASHGIMKVSVPGASFIIPPERALWLPQYTPHSVSTLYGVSFRSLYIDNAWATSLPENTTSINVDSLLRELILAVTLWDETNEISARQTRLLKVLIDQINASSSAPLFLNMPSDKRLQKIAATLSKNPADNTTLDKWSETIGATPRTLNRLFHKDTQMGFVQWRQRLRILYSLEQIDQGKAINLIALDMGYDSASAFITMFKKHLGCAPKQYLKQTATLLTNTEHSSPESAT